LQPAIHSEERDGGTLVRIAAAHREVLALWRTDQAFADRYTATLARLSYRGFFWETPPLTSATVARPYECMVVPSMAVGRLVADPRPFAGLIASGAGADIVTSRNLGGDAELVVPCNDGRADYAHLGAFLRTASRGQARALWRKAGETVERWLEEAPGRPVWLSTSGLGVSWLHIRIDTRPKYYSHTPYRELRA
jgi:hypothetical protein